MPLSRRLFLVNSSAAVAGAAVAGSAAFCAPTGRAWQLPPKRAIHSIENEWITLKDGTRLGARLWMPVDAAASPVPVVWEYLPYRKRDFERQRDTAWAE